jgi:hypothetical protein
LQTGFSAAACYGILRYAYPETPVKYLPVAACYAAGTALNAPTTRCGLTERRGAASIGAVAAASGRMAAGWQQGPK